MNIFVAVNGSAHSQYALEWTVNNVINPERDRLTVVAVLERVELKYFFTPEAAMILNDVQNAGLKAITKIANEAAECARKKYPDLRIDVALLQGGEVRDEITDFVNAQCQMEHVDEPGKIKDSQMLVLGCRGMGVLKRAFVGSTSDYCVHHVKCPVVIIKMN